MNFTRPEHLSYSTITSFISNRFSWFQGKILGRPFEGNVHTERGFAMEAGLDALVDGKSLSEAKELAVEKYRAACAGMPGYDVAMLTSIEKALDLLSQEFPYQDVNEKQKKITLDIGLPIPVIGYLDYRMNNGEIRDLKSTGKAPSAISQNYRIQGSIYREWGGGCDVIYCYSIHNKSGTVKYKEIPIEPSNAGKDLAYAKIAARAILKIYEVMNKPVFMMTEKDKQQLFSALMMPDLGACWNEKDYQEAADWMGLKTSLF